MEEMLTHILVIEGEWARRKLRAWEPPALGGYLDFVTKAMHFLDIFQLNFCFKSIAIFFHYYVLNT